ncbi:MAG: hypothetical protein HC920_10365 [Oscillatoriales cyanobacterium SM2_3_0]|nr:hypothetical protein [Oscillatoriales cyanobacterium SM2_3_0]
MSSMNVRELKIHGKDTCYVIPDQSSNDNVYHFSEQETMPTLEQKISRSQVLDGGRYRIKLESGWYNFQNTLENAQVQGEPLVVIWIFGHEGNPFINLNTGREIGTTWTTLNGLNDALEIEVKSGQLATVCALFLDVEGQASSGGEVQLSITDLSSDNQKILNIKSQENCWMLKANRLEAIKKPGYNFIELEPGDYEITIKSGQISYWQLEKKFELEPWALIWFKGGKVMPRYPIQKLENAVSESWCSLNGYQEKLTLKVSQKTTLFGLFFDTLDNDNEGEIVLSITPVDLEDSRYANKNYDWARVTSSGASVSPGGWGSGYAGAGVIPSSSGSPAMGTTSGVADYAGAGATAGSSERGKVNVNVETGNVETGNSGTTDPSVLPAWYTDDLWALNRDQDVVCVTPVRTIVRREEEILLIRRIRKVEEIDATLSCPINTTQISPVQQQE